MGQNSIVKLDKVGKIMSNLKRIKMQGSALSHEGNRYLECYQRSWQLLKDVCLAFRTLPSAWANFHLLTSVQLTFLFWPVLLVGLSRSREGKGASSRREN